MRAPSIDVRATTSLRAAEAMARAGAACLDVGAMSTAPYLAGRISEDEEADRLGVGRGSPGGQDRGARLRRHEPQRARARGPRGGRADHQ